MKKIKYYYNTNTLRYEKLTTPLRVQLLRFFIFILGAFFTAFIIVWIVFRFIPSPQVKLAEMKYNKMRQNYETLIAQTQKLQQEMRALEKRSVDMEKVEEILEKIERDILTKYSGLVKSSELGDMTLSYLLDLDEVAYVRFASVYKKFNSLENFLKEIEKINFESGKK